MIDWREFCEQNSVPYREGGASSARNNIYIACPMCGDDAKMLMGLDLETGAWGCWRDRAHRNSDPVGLIMKLLRISREDARTIVGLTNPHPTATALLARLQQMRAKPAAQHTAVDDEFSFGRAFVSPDRNDAAKRAVSRYLQGRDFKYRRDMMQHYAIRYHAHLGPRDEEGQASVKGPRVVLPVVTEAGVVIGYTARATVADDPLRYFSYPSSIAHNIYNADHAAGGGDVLIINEGPFDALKIDWYAQVNNLPVHAVALMGLTLTNGRARALNSVARRFTRVVALLDQSALAHALALQRQLNFALHVAQIDERYKDSGAVPWRDMRKFIKNFL